MIIPQILNSLPYLFQLPSTFRVDFPLCCWPPLFLSDSRLPSFQVTTRWTKDAFHGRPALAWRACIRKCDNAYLHLALIPWEEDPREAAREVPSSWRPFVNHIREGTWRGSSSGRSWSSRIRQEVQPAGRPAVSDQ